MVRRRRPPRPGALTELPPLKILSQIFILQAIWYLVATGLILFTALVAGRHFSFDMVLSWQSLRGDTTVGWMLGLVWLLNSFIGVLSILFFVSRSKLVPDFAITLHFIHLVITSLYSHSIPRNWLWWALQVASAGMMTSLGVWSCQWRELRPITFGGSSAVQPASNNAVEASAEQGGDEEQGYGRGRGRGRGRDGAGNYEMVGMKPETETGS
ncbi:integral membrane protein S linking to the trans Golgi network-domain-containing protein [Amylocarpus encephaloides]|uniref:Integral membrane protein S linking to the trans Golgi network-domain-containing protein n=1 Tax=Amylocarpus encephaloides TaxID=45428 RepID=A0A9P8C662_9HELO|nr:integral membrane protein S linking to the trans Golgi network-domain-containing protein [Amylocarpus encephaloides]